MKAILNLMMEKKTLKSILTTVTNIGVLILLLLWYIEASTLALAINFIVVILSSGYYLYLFSDYISGTLSKIAVVSYFLHYSALLFIVSLPFSWLALVAYIVYAMLLSLVFSVMFFNYVHEFDSQKYINEKI